MRFISSGYKLNHPPRRSRWSNFKGAFKKAASGALVGPKSANRSLRLPARPRAFAKKSSVNKSFLLIGSSTLLFILVWLGLLVWLPFFRVTKINYQGLKIVKQAVLEPIVNDILYKKSLLPANNFFLLNTNKIASALNSNSAFESVIVTKKFPDSLEINIQEKISSIIYDNGHSYYLLDRSGKVVSELEKIPAGEVVFGASASTSLSSATQIASNTPEAPIIQHTPDYQRLKSAYGGYPVLVDERGATTTVSGTIFLPKGFIDGILSIAAFNQNQNNGFLINYFIMDDPVGGVEAVASKPWHIKFDPMADIGTQLNNLKIIMSQVTPRAYIDLRYGDKVFWK